VENKSTIHIIGEATDRGSPNLISYKRMIITVMPDFESPAVKEKNVVPKNKRNR
jgi:hypothetical protein